MAYVLGALLLAVVTRLLVAVGRNGSAMLLVVRRGGASAWTLRSP